MGVNDMTRFDASTMAWMVRDHEERVSHLTYLGEDLAVGGWDGRIRIHDADGGELLDVRGPDRIVGFEGTRDRMVAASGRDIVCVRGGAVTWTTELEGSADAIRLTEEGFLAISSVYDIEHLDFMESTIWLLDDGGEVLERTTIDERPWYVGMDPICLALGRPRGGWLSRNNGAWMHHPGLNDAPIIDGVSIDGGHILLHADGRWSHPSHPDRSSDATPSNPVGIVAVDTGFLIIEEGANVSLLNEYGKVLWTLGTEATWANCSPGPVLGATPTIWASHPAGLEVRSATDGSRIAILETRSAVTTLANGTGRIALGTEGGEVMVFEAGMFQRHLERPQEPIDDRMAEMKARLRALRG